LIPNGRSGHSFCLVALHMVESNEYWLLGELLSDEWESISTAIMAIATITFWVATYFHFISIRNIKADREHVVNLNRDVLLYFTWGSLMTPVLLVLYAASNAEASAPECDLIYRVGVPYLGVTNFLLYRLLFSKSQLFISQGLTSENQSHSRMKRTKKVTWALIHAVYIPLIIFRIIEPFFWNRKLETIEDRTVCVAEGAAITRAIFLLVETVISILCLALMLGPLCATKKRNQRKHNGNQDIRWVSFRNTVTTFLIVVSTVAFNVYLLLSPGRSMSQKPIVVSILLRLSAADVAINVAAMAASWPLKFYARAIELTLEACCYTKEEVAESRYKRNNSVVGTMAITSGRGRAKSYGRESYRIITNGEMKRSSDLLSHVTMLTPRGSTVRQAYVTAKKESQNPMKNISSKPEAYQEVSRETRKASLAGISPTLREIAKANGQKSRDGMERLSSNERVPRKETGISVSSLKTPTCPQPRTNATSTGSGQSALLLFASQNPSGNLSPSRPRSPSDFSSRPISEVNLAESNARLAAIPDSRLTTRAPTPVTPMTPVSSNGTRTAAFSDQPGASVDRNLLFHKNGKGSDSFNKSSSSVDEKVSNPPSVSPVRGIRRASPKGSRKKNSLFRVADDTVDAVQFVLKSSPMNQTRKAAVEFLAGGSLRNPDTKVHTEYSSSLQDMKSVLVSFQSRRTSTSRGNFAPTLEGQISPKHRRSKTVTLIGDDDRKSNFEGNRVSRRRARTASLLWNSSFSPVEARSSSESGGEKNRNETPSTAGTEKSFPISPSDPLVRTPRILPPRTPPPRTSDRKITFFVGEMRRYSLRTKSAPPTPSGPLDENKMYGRREKSERMAHSPPPPELERGARTFRRRSKSHSNANHSRTLSTATSSEPESRERNFRRERNFHRASRCARSVADAAPSLDLVDLPSRPLSPEATGLSSSKSAPAIDSRARPATPSLAVERGMLRRTRERREMRSTDFKMQ